MIQQVEQRAQKAIERTSDDAFLKKLDKCQVSQLI